MKTQYLIPSLKLSSRIHNFQTQDEFLYVQISHENRLLVYEKLEFYKEYENKPGSMYNVSGIVASDYANFFERGEIDSFARDLGYTYSGHHYKNKHLIVKFPEIKRSYYDRTNKTITEATGHHTLPGFNLFTDEFIIYSEKNELDKVVYKVKRDFTTGEELWRFDIRTVNAELKIDRWQDPVCLYENLLIFSNHLDLFALDINTGKLVYHQPLGGYLHHISFDSGVIFLEAFRSPNDHKFQLRDCKTGEIIKEKIYSRELFTKKTNEQPTFTNAVIYKNYYVFAYINYQVCFMNRETMEIEHLFKMKLTVQEKSKASLDKITISNGMLHARSYNFNFWVFDLEGIV
ncbi:hypothetical protein [Cytophaga aurantiaca]|uniref:hypothetical protein n=1 Tax=Cytophaga aurantiaca TaxID=29530 RepID=UPI00037A7F75|nr:hypothetical protein [Cytophaga aurantiaca]